MTETARRFKVTSTQPGGSLLDELTGRPPSAPAAPTRPAPTPRPTWDKETPPARAPTRPAQPEESSAGAQRVPIRVQVPEDLADRVRAAVAALAYRHPDWSSLNAATAAALQQFVATAEKQHNQGQPFPWQPGRQLQPGRRVGR